MTLSIGATGTAQGPDPGISQELAEARAASLSDVRYDLEFELEQGMELVRGRVIVTFTTAGDEVDPVVLDFDGASLDALRVNGVEQATIEQVHNHLLIPAVDLDPGANQVAAEFTSRVAPTGTPLTIYSDRSRSEEFVYTLVVPADAHRLFPCFDQPDLKAVFSLKLTVPGDWIAVANGAEKHDPETTPEGRKRYEFEDTQPLSTYLMAFAAGTFTVLASGDSVSSRLFTRQSQLADLETDTLFSMHTESLAWLEDYFGYEYPFGKLDIVVLPGFPYGGMEHAGAIFYRESALVFDHEPTQGELLRRSTLIYHEVSHQWFGNLVTMHWFDDLWLKEGFATFIGYKALEALEPEQQAWLRFHQSVKPRAYRIDCTSGTTPVYQELGNLADAKSAYGAIVYNKAPAVLRELHDRIGSVAFRDGVRLFLNEHAFGNARWNDLVNAFERSSGESLAPWSKSWILSPGMPTVGAEWQDDGTGRVASFEIVQEDILGGDETWPLAVDILWIEADGSSETIRAVTDRARVRLEDVEGRPVPAAVLLNPQDVAYGQFLLGPQSQGYWLEHLPEEEDPLRRAIALSALWDSVREAALDPARFADLLLVLLETERDPQSQAWMLGALGTLLGRYLSDEDSAARAGSVTELLMGQLQRDEAVSALQVFRFLARHGSDAVQTLCEQALDDPEVATRLGIGERDRYLALSRLIAMGEAGERVAQMTGDNTPPGSERHAFLALASFANAETKADYFERYLDRDEPPEQWIQASLDHFHWPGQSKLTLPYLQKALEQVEWVKENRKIFFMPAWLDAFINGHSSREALEIVETFLAEHPDLSEDIVKKIQQSLDGLHRAVAIRERWQ